MVGLTARWREARKTRARKREREIGRVKRMERRGADGWRRKGANEGARVDK